MTPSSPADRDRVAACEFVLPGDPASLTGGYIFDRRIVAGLAAHGWEASVHCLDESFPQPTGDARDQARAVFASIADGRIVVVDGLALGGLPDVVAAEASRLRLVALIHHPLAEETGLEPARADALRNAERSALAHMRRVIVTSRCTSQALEGYDVPAGRIDVVEPGTDTAELARGSGGTALNLLCVAALIPRKGHAVLLNALAQLRERHWQLTCIGSASRDADTAIEVRRLITRLGLAARVRLLGEVDSATLAACYAESDVFVLASHMEGYGMALTEALARGLPIVSTTAGAIPSTVPKDAGLLVTPGDSDALAAALARLMDEPDFRGRLAAHARAARGRLPSWEQAARRFAAALDGV